MARRSGRRADYDWFNFGDFFGGLDIAVAATLMVTSIDFTTAQTIVRIRGRVGATLDAGAVDEHGMLLVGLMILNTDAFAGGGAAEIFTGGVDEASWIWQGAIYLSSGAEAAIVPDHLSGSVEVDTKAMRKVKAGQSLVCVIHAPTALWNDQAGTIDVHTFFHGLSAA